MLTEEGKKLVQDAKAKGMWLYDPSYKMWYSPEDFEHIHHYVDSNDDRLKQLQIRHPFEGIEAGFKRLAETEFRLQAFIRSVFKYYKK